MILSINYYDGVDYLFRSFFIMCLFIFYLLIVICMLECSDGFDIDLILVC